MHLSEIIVGARSSKLSQAQVREVASEFPHIHFIPQYVQTTGDLDQKTSLRALEKTNFFTKEIDEMQLQGLCRISIHSAKDLPDPLPKGLVIAALTVGVDSSDSLVFADELSEEPLIGTSCERREKSVKALFPKARCIDIRGTIEKRLTLLDEKKVNGLVIAEAALIRLNLTHLKRMRLEGETATHQGRLAILAREDDSEMIDLFKKIDVRQKKVLYLGLDPTHFKTFGQIIHYPVIKTIPRKITISIDQYTHIIFTSKTTVKYLPNILKSQFIIAIGNITAKHLTERGFPPHVIAEDETQEGIIAELEKMDLSRAHILLPHSSLARPKLEEYLKSKNIRYFACDLYDTVAQRPFPVPDLNLIDEIVFTSPSTVHAFLEIFSPIPREKKLTAIGPITKSVLDSFSCP